MKIRVEELEQWVMDLGSNPKDVASMQTLVKNKDIYIHELKRRIKIHGIEHVQTLELQIIQALKDQFMKKMVQMEELM